MVRREDAIAALTAWDELISHVTGVLDDGMVDAQEAQWQALCESALTELMNREWDRRCLDTAYGKCSMADVRRIGLEILRGEKT